MSGRAHFWDVQVVIVRYEVNYVVWELKKEDVNSLGN